MGFSILIKAIPYNYYALFTIIAMVALVVLQVDFGPMAKHEANAKRVICLPQETGRMRRQSRML